MAEQTEQRGPSLTMGQGGGGGPYVEKPEETALWAKLVRRFERNGGEGVTLDLRVKWTKLKYPHSMYRYNPESQQRQLITDRACLVVMQTTEPKLEGLYFFKDGKYSLDPKAFLYKCVVAAARGRIKDGQECDPYDYVGTEFLVPVTMKGASRKKDGTPDLSRGGHWWAVGDPKPIPLADDDEDDEPAPAPQAPTQVAAVADDDDEGVPF